MRHKRRNLWWLILGIVGLAGLGLFVNLYPPEKLLYLISFFGLIFFAGFWLFLFSFNNVRRAVLVALGTVVYLILRYFGLTAPFYLILLLAALFSLELVLKGGQNH